LIARWAAWWEGIVADVGGELALAGRVDTDDKQQQGHLTLVGWVHSDVEVHADVNGQQVEVVLLGWVHGTGG
jgi:hypothetical protein